MGKRDRWLLLPRDLHTTAKVEFSGKENTFLAAAGFP